MDFSLDGVHKQAFDCMKPTNCWGMFFARFVCGLANGAIRCLIPIYIYDIVSDVQKKRMDFLLQAQFAFGVLIVFISARNAILYITQHKNKYTENSYIPNIVATTVSLIFMISFLNLPESPRFLCFKRETNLAREIIAKLRTIDANLEETLRIWSQREQIVETNPVKILFDGKLQPNQLITLIGLVIFEQLIGAISALFYMHKILKLTHGEFTPEMTAILCCAIFTAGIAFPNICSYVGKTKTVLVWSSTCMAISLGALGIYCHYQGTFGEIDDYKVMPLVFLGFFYFCFAIGPHSFTWQYVQETIPVEHFFNIRNLLVAVSWMVIFAITRVLPRLIDVIGVGWLFWYMSLMCLFLTIFSAVVVPEYSKLPEERKLVYAGESSEGDV
ncbi:Facilitated trehalose transporter Tret1 [Pseudolycoriella hygida]|uniref:Facilitated trehalose transporter Tret1 n=1 Tax=Pseudolycoriella hygida TaxID=35572 RepID=A0A9Q0MWD8_9DIPT|nr:Facilitated trehalose transporter Tret1 [Pseudolycoriella hygida]